jgi:16S rRNA (uracil1498-N3)-methyltransferase
VSYFLFDGVLQLGVSIVLEGPEAVHLIGSRRIRVHEQFSLQDQQYQRYRVRVERIGRHDLSVVPLCQLPTPAEPAVRLLLFQALVKEKALDFIIQKATELGVADICLFPGYYSQPLKADTQSQRKLDRWRKIAIEACKQSGRVRPPSLHFLSGIHEFQQFSPESSTETRPMLCLTSAGSMSSVPLDEPEPGNSEIYLLVGPEGGWHPSDLEGVAVRPVHLGPRILRAETAALAAIAILQYRWGDLQLPAVQD